MKTISLFFDSHFSSKKVYNIYIEGFFYRLDKSTIKDYSLNNVAYASAKAKQVKDESKEITLYWLKEVSPTVFTVDFGKREEMYQVSFNYENDKARFTVL